MLVELLIENYAVVENLRVRFFPGMNALTGETGSGKSIVVDALGLLFGGRASAEMVRSGAQRARISGIFALPEDASLIRLMDDAGLVAEDGELLLEREILANGKSRAFAASRPVTAAILRDLAQFFGDIHGQHDQQRLFAPELQREMLDEFADAGRLSVQVAGLYRRWRSTATDLEEIDRQEKEKLRLLDVWNFQRKEIEAAKLTPNEETTLDDERRVLQNVTRLQESAGVAYEALYEAEESVHKQLRVALKRVDDLTRIDPSLQEVSDTLKPAMIAVEEASHVLRDYLGRLEADPERLEFVENRLATIDKLKRKYGGSIEEILSFLEQVRQDINAVESAGERRAALQQEQTKFAAEYQAVAAKLTAKRQEAARKLEKRVEAELKQLAMASTRFRVQVTPGNWSADGSDEILFLLSANVGEEPRPLEKVASGGELSRVALALKTCTMPAVRRTDGLTPRTLVFDEVDAGIGGAAAEMVGRRLKQIAGENQVLCVTHLAQIAGFADHHYAVEKREVKGRTLAAIQELSGEARTREIGRMLSGQHLTPEALRHAEQLIRSGAEA